MCGVSSWKSTDIPQRYVDAITYVFPKLNIDLAFIFILFKTRMRQRQIYKGFAVTHQFKDVNGML